jgi:xanthine/CO dehydrogenase XdhC/CoxF family maturation factor
MALRMEPGKRVEGKKSPANLLVGPHRAQAHAANIWHKSHPMSIHRLLPLFERACVAGEPLVLATVIRTAGSTYAKPGALMLIARDGEYAGLLSGGCLEGDLREHAREVVACGQARIVSYDMRSQDDQLFGLGAGCEGAMDILLTRHGPDTDWQVLRLMERGFRTGCETRIAFVTTPGSSNFALGSLVGGAPQSLLHEAAARAAGNSLSAIPAHGAEVFVAAIAAPLRILLLGGGPDARPVAEMAAFLGWRVTVVDHRSSYLDPKRFPAGATLVETPAADVADAVAFEDYSAAIVMSHHLDSDLQYLRALASSPVRYVGLLGPAARREKLLGDLGEPAPSLRTRLRAPVGLDIGGRTPEAIALSIIGEVQAALAGRGGRPFSETA